MAKHRSRIALLSVLLIAPWLSSSAEQPEDSRWTAALSSSSGQPARQARQESGERLARGRVTQVHAPRLFTIEEADGAGGALLVLTPRALSTPVIGAMVEVRGRLRRFTDADLKDTPGWNEIDQRTREELAGRPVLVASSVIASAPGEARSRTAESAPSTVAPVPVVAVQPALTLRPATLVDHIDELAGQNVRILNARVVGVFEPRAFLIEPATRYEVLLGHRDRVLVLIDAASLRVSPALVVASTVTIVGVARTLTGVQVTAEVPWPPSLDRDLIKRLEVRAAILARSVQTPEGTELTDRSTPER